MTVGNHVYGALYLQCEAKEKNNTFSTKFFLVFEYRFFCVLPCFSRNIYIHISGGSNIPYKTAEYMYSVFWQGILKRSVLQCNPEIFLTYDEWKVLIIIFISVGAGSYRPWNELGSEFLNFLENTWSSLIFEEKKSQNINQGSYNNDLKP